MRKQDGTLYRVFHINVSRYFTDSSIMNHLQRSIAIGFAMMLLVVSCQTVPLRTEDGTIDVAVIERDSEQSSEGGRIALEDYSEAMNLLLAEGINPEEISDPAERGLLAAQASFLMGDTQSALALLDDIGTPSVLEREILYMRALIASSERDWDTAEGYFLEVLRIDDTDPQALAALATVYMETESYTESQRLYQKSIELDRNSSVLQSYATLFQRQKQYLRAEEIYTEALELDPDNHMLYAERGQVRVLQDAFVPAIADYTRAINLNPDYPWHYLDRGKTQAELRRIDKAIEDYNVFIEYHPDVFITYYYRGQMYEAQHNYPLAREDYEKALTLQADFHPAYSGYARSLFAMGMYEQALKYLYKIYEMDPYAEYAMLVGLALYATNRIDELNAFLIPVVKAMPQNDIFNLLLRSMLNKSLLTRAEQTVAKEKDTVDKTKGYYYIGAFHEIMGNGRLARSFYEAASAENRRELFETAMALYRIDQYKP